MKPGSHNSYDKSTPSGVSLIKYFRYRPEIDGLRAVAVSAVVLYHAGFGFPGGFVGVDVFFVISGFLITSLIVRDLERGTFTLAGFWERRARRIIPAAVVLLSATLLAGGVLLLPADYLRLGKSAISQAFFAANVYFCRSTNYFSGLTPELPLLQTWSLGVEEQFYFIVPLLFVFIFRFRLLRRPSALVTILAVGAVLSCWWSQHDVVAHPAKAFYLLPSRAWELLAGAILAIYPIELRPQRPAIREAVSFSGLAACLLACSLYNRDTPFPGIAALLPCLGAALFIWANGSNTADGRPPTRSGRLLATPPFVLVGGISYSLYLWHWPLFAFARYWSFEPLRLNRRLAIVATSFVLAFLSWRFIETPFRKRRVCARRQALFVFTASALASVFLLGLGIVLSRGAPKRLPGNIAAFAEGAYPPAVARDVTTEDIISGSIPTFGRDAAARGRAIDVLLWGDSHAKHFAPALEAVCGKKRLIGQIISFTSTLPLLGWSQQSSYGLNEQAESWCQAVLDYVKRNRVPTVILAAKWDDPENSAPQTFPIALERTIGALRATGARVYVMMQVPSHKANVPRVLVFAAVTHSSTAPWQSTGTEHAWKHRVMYRVKADSYEFGSALVDPAPSFREGSTDCLKMEANGRPLYFDAQHLTVYGSELLITPLLEMACDRAIKGTHAE